MAGNNLGQSEQSLRKTVRLDSKRQKLRQQFSNNDSEDVEQVRKNREKEDRQRMSQIIFV